jgi:3-deoxy-manno-octulosonate cytidylyltransferase (CMP-KDO synthetase)
VSVSSFTVLVPARLGSTRLPGKPLLEIAGKPMIAHVCARALEAGAEVFLATDDARIAAAVADMPVTAVMTREDHASGTERIAEVAEKLGWADSTLVVNLQGDEPLMRPELIRQLAEALAAEPTAQVATLAAPIEDPSDVFDPHAVKVVLDRHGHALYFSRAPIPWWRDQPPDATASGPDPRLAPEPPLRHIGIYGYRAGFLRQFPTLAQAPIERTEALEQLRAMWHGHRIAVHVTALAPGPGVDTPDDLARVRRLLQL